MSGPSISTMGSAAGRTTAVSAQDRQAVKNTPRSIPGEAWDAEGRPSIETNSQLSRSPGCFSVTLAGDRKSLWIGEDWVGLGESEAEGGLEGCSVDSPGMVFLADGRMIPVGGKTQKTAALMFEEAGSDGNTMLLALVPEPDTATGIAYYAIHVSETIADNLGVWDNTRDFLPSGTYDNHYVVPIAMLKLFEHDDTVWIDDVYWNLETPVATLGGGSSAGNHPWRIVVSGETFDVLGGSVNIAVRNSATTNTIVVPGLTAVAVGAATTYVWLEVTHPNAGPALSVAELKTGLTLPASTYVYDTYPSNGDPLPTLAGYATLVFPVGSVTSAGVVDQRLREDQYAPYGVTIQKQTTVGYKITADAILAYVTTETKICGIDMSTAGISAVTLLETQPTCTTT